MNLLYMISLILRYLQDAVCYYRSHLEKDINIFFYSKNSSSISGIEIDSKLKPVSELKLAVL